MLKSLIMKTLKNLFYMFVILAVGGLTTSCSEDKTEPAFDAIKGDGIYFPNSIGSVVYLTDGANSVDIPVMRTYTDNATEVGIQSFGTDEIFTVPATVSFAAGEATANLTITYSAAAVEEGKEYPLSLVIGDVDHETAYGDNSLIGSLLLDPWQPLGKASYADAVMFNNTYMVDAYIKKGTDNEFRFYRPYEQGLNSPEEGYATQGQVDDYLYVTVDYATGLVTYEPHSTGINYQDQDGATFILTHPADMTDRALPVKNNCMIAEGVFQLAPAYNVPGKGFLDYSGYTGVVTIVLPGYSNINPQMAAEYVGTLNNPDGEYEVLFDVICNSDVAYYYVTLVEGEPTNDDITAMINGSDKRAQQLPGHEETQRLSYILDTPGVYYLLTLPVATVDGEDTLGEVGVVEVEFNPGGIIAPADFTVEITAENVDFFEGDIKAVPNSKTLPYYISLMSKSDYQKCLNDAGSIDKYMVAYWTMLGQNNGGYTLDEVVEILEVGQKGDFEEHVSELDPATEYVVFAYCIDMNGGTYLARSEISTYNFTTEAEPAAEAKYAEWLGSWSVTSTSSAINKKAVTFNINISKFKQNSTFKVQGWGNAISQLESQWKMALPVNASYNAETGTLHLHEGEVETTSAGYLYFFALLEVDGGVAFGSFGPSVPFFNGTVDGNSATIDVSTIADSQGNEYTVCGADYFHVVGGQPSIFMENQDPTTGPYTLTKKSGKSVSAKSKSGEINAPFMSADLRKLQANPSLNSIRVDFSMVVLN